jgi:inner membrane protein
VVWPLLLVTVVVCIDLITDAGSRSAQVGVLDEPAHLATGILVLLLVVALLPTTPGMAFALAVLVACVAIDLDHIPQYLGWQGLTEGTPRPYTHSLLTPLVLCALAAVSRGAVRAIVLGAAVGVGAHLLRDVATASGVALFWPATSEAPRISHPSYIVVLVLIAAVGIACAARAGSSSSKALRR